MAKGFILSYDEAIRVLWWFNESDRTYEVCIPTLGECHGSNDPDDPDCMLCKKLRKFIWTKKEEE